jgi:hypothetical protein
VRLPHSHAARSRAVSRTFRASGDESIAESASPRATPGAGRWSFLLPPRAWPSLAGASGAPGIARDARLSPAHRAPSWSCSASEHLAPPRPKFGLPPVGFVGLRVARLTACAASRAPVGPRIAPPSVSSVRVHSRHELAFLPSAPEMPSPKSCSAPVVFTTSTVSSAHGAPALLQRVADPGVRRVSGTALAPIDAFLRKLPVPARRFPATLFHPSKTPPNRRRTPSLGPLPSWRSPVVSHRPVFRALLVGRVRFGCCGLRHRIQTLLPGLCSPSRSSAAGASLHRGFPSAPLAHPGRGGARDRSRSPVDGSASEEAAGPPTLGPIPLAVVAHRSLGGAPPKSVRTGMSQRFAGARLSPDAEEPYGPPWGL